MIRQYRELSIAPTNKNNVATATATCELQQEVLNAQQFAFNKSCVGQTLKVLLDRPGRVSGQLVGRSPYMQAVHVDGAGLEMGSIVKLKITKAHA